MKVKAPDVAQLLGMLNQVQLDGGSVALQLGERIPSPEGNGAGSALTVELKARELVLRSGPAEGVTVSDVHVVVGGLSSADLLAPGPDLLKKADVAVQGFAVRVSREWLNGVLAREPMLREMGFHDVHIVFSEENPHLLIVRGSTPKVPISFEVDLLLGVDNNRVTVVFDAFRLGFLPFPKWLRSTILSVAQKQLHGKPGITMSETTIEVDVLKLAPIPLRMQLTHFGTRGNYVVVESAPKGAAIAPQLKSGESAAV